MHRRSRTRELRASRHQTMKIYLNLMLQWSFLSVLSVTASKFVRLPTSDYIIENISSSGIFCHEGAAKTIQALWWTLEIHVKVISGKVMLYPGGSPEDIFKNYKYYIEADSKFHALIVDPFKTACVAVNVAKNHVYYSRYNIRVALIVVDEFRVMIMAAGIIVIFSSKFLSRNPAIYYLCASVLVVIFLLVPILYFVCQRSAQHCVSTGALISIAYVLFVDIYDKYFIMYILFTGAIGFAVAYRIGPPDHPRIRCVIMWAFRGIGVMITVWSSWYEEASWVIAITALGISYMLPCLRGKRRNRLY